MSPRSEYLVALVAAHPVLIAAAFLSLLLCAIVFLGSVFLRTTAQTTYAANLPLEISESKGHPQEESL